jgi:hypothetical protein
VIQLEIERLFFSSSSFDFRRVIFISNLVSFDCNLLFEKVFFVLHLFAIFLNSYLLFLASAAQVESKKGGQEKERRQPAKRLSDRQKNTDY